MSLDKCDWKQIDDEQTVKVMEKYDLNMMNEPGARIGFKDSNCVIKECVNEADKTLIDDPVYRLVCPPSNDGRGQVVENITTKIRREQMARENPYSTFNNRRQSPNSVVYTPTNGGRFTKKIKKKQRTVKRHKKRTIRRYKPRRKLTHKYKNK